MTKPIRVAHIMGKMVGGGLEQVVINYYRHIDRSSVQFDFIVDSDSSLVPREDIESLGGHVFVVPPYQHIAEYQHSLIDLFRKQGWTIVHSHENALSVFPLRAAKRAGVAVRIAHSHSTAGKGETVRNFAKNILRPFSNVYPTYRMACSSYAGRWLFGKRADFNVMHNAIELTEFDYNLNTRMQVRSDLGFDSETLVIGHIGRFVTQKNHFFLLDVFEEVIKLRNRSVLVLVGDGPLINDVKNRAEQKGISDHILYLGQRKDVSRLYQAFDAFCLPSNYEGLGMVAVEAQASGLPTFCSDRVPEEAKVSSVAKTINLADGAEVWAKAILEAHGALRSSHIDELRAAGYDIEYAAKQMEEVYLNLYREATKAESSKGMILL